MPETSPLAPEASPLVEADPDSVNLLISDRINDIFNKPPLTLSDSDLRAAVEYYRKERGRFLLESVNKAPRAKPGTKAEASTRAKAKAPTSVAEALAGIQASMDLL